MKYRECFDWILEHNTENNLYKRIEKNIAFVHSMGLKCDSVGWCRLDLAQFFFEVLTEIE